MPRDQLNGFAGANQQGSIAGHIRKDVVRHADCSVGHRHRVFANSSLRAHPLGNGERMFEQTGQERTARFMLASEGIGVLELAENLRLSKHHGVQPRRNPHDVAHGV